MGMMAYCQVSKRKCLGAPLARDLLVLLVEVATGKLHKWRRAEALGDASLTGVAAGVGDKRASSYGILWPSWQPLQRYIRIS